MFVQPLPDLMLKQPASTHVGLRPAVFTDEHHLLAGVLELFVCADWTFKVVAGAEDSHVGIVVTTLRTVNDFGNKPEWSYFPPVVEDSLVGTVVKAKLRSVNGGKLNGTAKKATQPPTRAQIIEDVLARTEIFDLA